MPTMQAIDRDTRRDAPDRAARRRLALGLLGGAIAWLGHFLLAYAISEFGCVAGWGEVRWLGLSGVAWALLILSLAMATVAAGAILVAWRCRRETTTGDREYAQSDTARVGLITSGLFLLVILAESIPIFFFLRSC